MFIDNVTYDLIFNFINSSTNLTVKDLALKIGKSRRIVYYAIEKVNIELKKNGIDLVYNIPRKGICINESQKNFLRLLIKDVEYTLSTDERRKAMAVYLLTYPKKHTVENLVDKFLVTKNTVICDIKEIKKRTKKFNEKLDLVTATKGGYILKGPVLFEIQYLYSILKEIFNSKNTKFIQYFLMMYSNLGYIFTDEFISLLIEKLIYFEEKLGKEITPKELDNLIFSFPYLYLFSLNNRNESIKGTDILKERLEYRYLKDLFVDLKLEYNDNVLMLFTLIVLSTGKILDVHSKSKQYEKYIEYAKDMVDKFCLKTKVKIDDKDEIINDIVTYLKVIYVRREYKIISFDIDCDKVKKEYKELYDIIYEIAKEIDDNFNAENIAVLTMAFARVYKKKKCRILIVTDESAIIKKLIRVKIENLLKNVKIENIIRKSKIYKMDLSNIDLIVSTEVLDVKKEVVIVDSVFKDDDMINIVKAIYKKG